MIDKVFIVGHETMRHETGDMCLRWDMVRVENLEFEISMHLKRGNGFKTDLSWYFGGSSIFLDVTFCKNEYAFESTGKFQLIT